MRESILRILSAVFLLPLALVCFSLSVPPGDLLLFIIMLLIAVAGMALSLKESRKWRWVWSIALAVSIFGGVVEVIGGKQIAQQRSKDRTSVISTNR